MNANFTAAAPSATAFSVQRPVCTEVIGKAVLLSRWSCGFCWFRKHSGFFWEKHNGNDAYYFNYTHIYILFKIKILVTRGSPLMVPCIFLQQLLRDSPTCVTEPGTGSFWSTLPSFSNHLQSSSLTRPVTPLISTPPWILLRSPLQEVQRNERTTGGQQWSSRNRRSPDSHQR